MYRVALALMLGGLLAGCSHTPPVEPPAGKATPASPSAASCAQAGWEAETAPVINKRQGQDALDSYEADNGEGHAPCP